MCCLLRKTVFTVTEEFSKPETFDFLINYGDVKFKNNILLKACQRGNNRLVKILIKNGKCEVTTAKTTKNVLAYSSRENCSILFQIIHSQYVFLSSRQKGLIE